MTISIPSMQNNHTSGTCRVKAEPEHTAIRLLILFVLLAVLLSASAGTADATDPFTLNEPVTAEITVPGGISFYEFTPSEDGMYRYYSIPSDAADRKDPFGYLMDEDMQLIASDDDGGENGQFRIVRRLYTGRTYYLGVRLLSGDATGSCVIRLEKIEGVYAEAKADRMYTLPNQTGTAEVTAYSPNGGLTFQWYDGSALIPGATGTAYTFPALTETKTYRCVVTDAAGLTAEAVTEARISSGLRLSGTGDGEVPYGGEATLRINAEADYGANRITYRWRERMQDEDGNYYDDIKEGATGPAFSLSNITRSRNIWCMVSDINGDEQGYCFHISVSGGVTAEAAGEETVRVAAGDPVTLAVTAVSPYPVSYRWYEQIRGEFSCEWVPIAGADGPTYTTDPVYAAKTILCEAVNSVGNSSSVYFEVFAEDAFLAEADGASEARIVPGETATFRVKTLHSIGTVSYQWYRYDSTFGLDVPVRGATAASYTLFGSAKGGTYSCRAHDLATGADSTVWFEADVDNSFSVQADSDTVLSLNAGETAGLKVKAASDTGGIIFRWYRREYDAENDYYRERDMVDGAQADTLMITASERCEYECVASDLYGNTGRISFEVRIANDFSLTTEENSLTVPAGESFTLSAAGNCSAGGIIYRWSHYDPEAGYRTVKESAENFLTIGAAGAGDCGEYMLYAFDPYGNSGTAWFRISIENHLAAEAAGNDNLTVVPGQSAELAVTAACDAGQISYQWYQQEKESTDSWHYALMNGRTQAVLTLPDIQDSCYYLCLVRDEFGGEQYVYFSISIDNGLTAGALNGRQEFTASPGGSVTMAVDARCGTGELSYQWYQQLRHEDGSVTDEAIGGAAGASCTVSGMTRAGDYFCRIRDAYGSMVHVWFHVDIDNELTARAENDRYDFTVEPGGTAVLKVEAGCRTGGLNYQWYRYVTTEDESGNISLDRRMIDGAEGAAYTAIAENAGERTYSCEVTDLYGNRRYVLFHITVDNEFSWQALTGDNGDITVQPGETVELAVNCSCKAGRLTYQWYQMTEYPDENEGWKYHQEAVTGATGSTYTTGPVQEHRTYVCDVADEYGDAVRIWFHISIDNGLTAYAQDGTSLSVHPGEPAQMTVTAECVNGPLTYQWYEYTGYINEDGEYRVRCVPVENDSGSCAADAVTGHREYLCRVSDPYGNTEQIRFEIETDNELSAWAYDMTDRITVQTGGTAVLKAEASCYTGGLAYQWYAWDENTSDEEEISGATGSTFTTGAITCHRKYFCRVYDEFGSSADVWFEVEADNGLVAEAYGGQTDIYADPAEAVTLAVSARCDSGGLTYQWYQEDPESAEWYPAENGQDAVYTTEPLYRTTLFLCRVSDTFGNSRDICFTVYADNELTAVPAGSGTRYAKPGSDVTLSVIATCIHGDISYQWYTGNWDILEGATGASYTAANVMRHEIYYCVMTDEYDNVADIRFDIYIDNGLTASALNGFSSVIVPYGEQTTLTVSAGCKNGGVTYQWLDEDGNELEGETSAAYTTEAVTRYQRFTCRVRDQYDNTAECGFDISVDSGLTAEPAGAYLFHVSDAPVTLAVSAGSLLPDTTFSFEWYDEFGNQLDSTADPACTLTDPKAGRYQCRVSDGYQTRTVWFYITDDAFAWYYGDENELYANPGQQVTMRVAAWNEEDDITYQWYEDSGTGDWSMIAGATEASCAYTVNSRRTFFCRVTGTGLSEDIQFEVYVSNPLEPDMAGLRKIHVIPAGGSVQLTMNITSRWDDELTYRWFRNGEELPGETGHTLTVTAGGDYQVQVNDRYGTSPCGEEFWCIEGQPETVSEGDRAAGPEDGTRTIRQFIPDRAGLYEIGAEGYCEIYRTDDWWEFMSLFDENRTVRLNAGTIYYVILDNAADSFSYSLFREEQTEYTLTLQSGQRLRIPPLAIDGSRIHVEYAISDNPSVVHASGNCLTVRKPGTANVTATCANGMQTIYHITVESRNTLILPEGLETIEEDAFNGDTGIRSVRLSDTVQTVKNGAFANTGNICVTVENDRTLFEDGVFSHSNPVIICAEESSAADYCRSHGITYFSPDGI